MCRRFESYFQETEITQLDRVIKQTSNLYLSPERAPLETKS